jgi:tetratricopeptide (TPR) repeat protein/DNA-binding winged helix-turn-helix (wHTH) protein
VKAELLQGFYLGEVFVEPLTRRITGPGFSERLTPKATEVLLQLAMTPSSLVTREMLLNKVWGEGKGSPEAISNAIRELRHAFRDAAESPRYIQTVPGRGYRLILTPQFPDDQASTIVPGARGGDGFGALDFVQNLRQRGVLEAALAYLVFGWLIIQVADVVFAQLLLPQWMGTFVTYLVLAGFPVVLLLSWFLEYRDGKAMLDRGPQRYSPRRRFSRTYLSVVGSLLVASAAVFVYDRYVGLPEAEQVAPQVPEIVEESRPVNPNSIAVLRFLNIDGSEQTEIFASGFAEDLLTRLSRLPGMSVSSRGDAWSLGPTSASTDVRRRLRVAYYVEGSVRLVGDDLGVNVKLIDSETGFQVTSRSFDAAVEDFNRIQREITNMTVANLRVALPPETLSMLESMYEEADLDSYILYRRGREMFERPRTIESLTGAIELFRQALSFDPDYAAAHAGLCSAYVEITEVRTSSEDIREAESACGFALRSDSRLYMVYSALGELYQGTGRIAEAEEAFDEALAINPQDVQAMAGLAGVYRRTERFPEAEELLNTAIERQPGNWRAINNLGGFLFGMGRYKEAAEQYREVVLIDSENFAARTNLGSALTMAAEFEEGRQVYEESLAIRPNQRGYSNLGVIYYYLGEFEKSLETHRQAARLAPTLALVWLNLADSQFFANQRAEAAASYQKAFELSTNVLSVNPSDGEAVTTLAWAQHMLGDSVAALTSIDRGLRIDSGDPYTYYYDAMIRYQTGDREAALSSLAAALERGYPPGLLVAEPHLGELRADDRFHAIIVANIR